MRLDSKGNKVFG